jgi:hypothetical protein
MQGATGGSHHFNSECRMPNLKWPGRIGGPPHGAGLGNGSNPGSYALVCPQGIISSLSPNFKFHQQ